MKSVFALTVHIIGKICVIYILNIYPNVIRSTYTKINETINRQRRPVGGGGIMYWGMVMPNGLVALRQLKGKQNSEKYITLLESFAVPCMKLNLIGSFSFIHDNASIHKSSSVEQFLNNQSFETLHWPAKSPDLNLMENIWKMISDLVYESLQPKNNKDLEQRIWHAVDEINQRKRVVVVDLFETFRCRLTKVLRCNGNIIN